MINGDGNEWITGNEQKKGSEQKDKKIVLLNLNDSEESKRKRRGAKCLLSW
jgi:hypothetical protein